MSSIIFDSVELVNSTYAPQYIKHESAPERDLSIMDLAREGGAILISEKYGKKYITVIGSLKAASQSALETAIDSFKELFSRVEKNLDISWGGGTRRYVATCQEHTFERSHLNITFVPWRAVFVVVSGIGEDTSETTLVNNDDFTAASKSGSLTFLGSAEPKPRIRVKCGVAATDPKGICIENTDKGERFIITRSAGLGAGEYFEMDCRLKTAKYDGDAVPFYGVFPDWIVGANAYKIQIGKILDQSFTGGTAAAGFDIYVNTWEAQSFTVPNRDATYQAISLYLKTGPLGITTNLTVEIQGDSAGEPDGTPVTNAEFDIAYGDVGTSFAWITVYSTNAFTLAANTRYWTVIKCAGGDASHYYEVGYVSGVDATYKRGCYALSTDGGSNWNAVATQDLWFKLYYGGKEDAAKTYYFDVYYYKRYL